MHAVAPAIARWFDAGAPAVALATTVRTWGSAPLPVGSVMAVAPDGAFSGSVSGGCVEGAVVAAALALLAGDGAPRRLTFDVGDETAWSVGLACGGRLEVWIERWTHAGWRPVALALAGGTTSTLTRVVGGPFAATAERWLDGHRIATGSGEGIDDGEVGGGGGGQFDGKLDGKVAANDDADRFTLVLAARPHIVVVGAGEIAVALAKLATAIERRVTVIDPRRAFAAADRFPAVDAILHDGPDDALRTLAVTETTAIVILSHDPKIDDPALEAALESAAGYIGALGGRVSQAARRDRLRGAGWGDADLARIHGPVGLAIGARTPAEIAVSILAEIVACEHGAAPGS